MYVVKGVPYSLPAYSFIIWAMEMGHPAICFLTITRATDNPATKKFSILDLTAPIGFRISEYLAATLPGIYILAIAPAPPWMGGGG